MTNSERIQAHNAELREAIQMAENLPDAGSGEVVEPVIEPLEVTENGTYTPPVEIDGFSPVTVNVPERYEEGYSKGFTDGKTEGYEEGHTEGYNKGVEDTEPDLRELTATENITYEPNGFDGYSSVVVNVPLKYNEGYNDGFSEGKSEGYNEGYQASQDSIILHEKTVDIIENGSTEVTPDDGKYLSKVTVEVNVPVPDGYIVPDGTKEIEENGTHDVTEYASVNVNVPTGNEALETILFDNGGSVTIPSVKKPIRAYSFYNCTKLTSVTIPEGVTGLNTYAFYGCSSLTEIILPKTLTTIGSYSFRNCTTLNRVVLNATTITVGLGSMMDCTALTTLDIQGKAHFLASACANCSNLNALILRSNTMCTVAASSAFSNSGVANGTCYIYVPSGLVDTYKAATTWSAYADRIRAIEDYPEITGG